MSKTPAQRTQGFGSDVPDSRNDSLISQPFVLADCLRRASGYLAAFDVSSEQVSHGEFARRRQRALLRVAQHLGQLGLALARGAGGDPAPLAFSLRSALVDDDVPILAVWLLW